MRTISKNWETKTTLDFQPHELESMRRAFSCACHDNPALSSNSIQRYDLADAMVNVYQKHFTQKGLIAATLRKLQSMNAHKTHKPIGESNVSKC